jgi:hypothetical protein
MDWLSSNWVWLAFGAFILFAMSRGGCGMNHGGHNQHRLNEEDQLERRSETAPLSTSVRRVNSDDTTLQPADDVHEAPVAKEAALATEHAGHANASGSSEARRHHHGC